MKFTTLPLVPGPWKALDEGEVNDFIARLDMHLMYAGMRPPLNRLHRLRDLRAVPLSFYPGWLVVEGEAELEDDLVGTLGVLMGPGFIWCMDGGSTLVHALNRGALPRGVHIHPSMEGETTPAQARASEFFASPLGVLEPARTGPDYLRFFCNGIRGADGAFRVVESEEDLRLCGADEALAKSWAELLNPVHMEMMDEEAGDARNMAGRLTLFYGGQLFIANMVVEPTGVVTMNDDRAIARETALCEVTRGLLRHIRPLDGQSEKSPVP